MFCTVYNRYHGWSGCNGIHYCRYMTTVYLLPYNVLYCFIRSNRDRIGFYAEIQIICMLQAAELGLADRLYCLAYGPPPVYRYTSLITNIETIFKIIKWTRKARCVIFRGFKRVFRHEGGNFSCHNRQGFSTALIFLGKVTRPLQTKRCFSRR